MLYEVITLMFIPDEAVAEFDNNMEILYDKASIRQHGVLITNRTDAVLTIATGDRLGYIEELKTGLPRHFIVNHADALNCAGSVYGMPLANARAEVNMMDIHVLDVHMAEAAAIAVITSYSIHYTKLYERRSLIRRPDC